MPSSYTTSLKLTLPQTGDLIGSWGGVVNSGVTSLVDQAVAGSVTITMTPDTNYTLTSTNGASDEARNMFINVSGGPHTATRNVICPAVSKLFVVTNSTSGGQSILFKTLAGTGVTIPNGVRATVYCDGTNLNVFGTWGVSGNPVLVGALSTTGSAVINGSLSTTGSAFINGSLGVNTNSIISALTVNGDMAFSSTEKAIYHYYSSPSNYASTTTSVSGDILWLAGTGGVQERMRLTSAGLLGVNNTSPVCTLDIGGAARIGYLSSAQFLLNLGTTGSGGFRSGYLYGDGTNMILANQQNGALSFYTNNTPRMQIGYNGYVGIGSTSFTNFSVVGDVPGAGVLSVIRNTSATAGSSSALFFWNENGYSPINANLAFFSSAAAPGNSGNEFRITSSDVMSFYSYGAERLQLGAAFFFSTIQLKADGVSVPTGYFTVPSAYNTTASGSYRFACLNSDGTLTSQPASTRRVKTDIQPLMDASFVMALSPVTFKRKKLINGMYLDTPLSDEIEYGFIAEEVSVVAPRLATYEKVRDADGNVIKQPDGLDPVQFIAPAIRFVQQLKNEIDALRAELNALKGVN